jgi:hypothetical protein
VDAAAGRLAESRKQLAPILSQSGKSANIPYLFEARLTACEIAVRSGQDAIAHVQLASLEKQAREKNFLLIARKAATLYTPQSH